MKQKILILFTMMIISQSSFAEIIQGKVIGIADGDTITLLDDKNIQHKIRLSGIDAPEKKQPFGNVSKSALSDCAFSKLAHVETFKSDRYGRLIGKVRVDDIDCNLRQLELGLAWHYKKYMNEQSAEDRLKYSSAQIKAMVDHVGLWRDPDAVPPWDFRKGGKP